MSDPDRMTRAPFCAEQIASINAYQEACVFHPFTCDRCGTDLRACETGMICPAPDCAYVQDWVHPFMADESWREMAPTMRWPLLE